MMRRIVLGLLAVVIVASGFLLNSDHQQPTYVYAVTVGGVAPKHIPNANVKVPDVVGLPFDDAARKVERVGLYVAEPAQEVAGRLTDRIEKIDAALASPVRHQTPAAGTRVRTKTTVILSIR